MSPFGCFPEKYAEKYFEIASAGADIITDTYAFANPAYCQYEKRIPLIADRIGKLEKSTLYVINITGSSLDMIKNAQKIANLSEDVGLNVAFRFCPISTGSSIIKDLRERFEVPIFIFSSIP